MTGARDETLMTITVDIVAAHAANNPLPIAEIGGLIARAHDAIAGLSEEAASETDVPFKPAVSIRSSVKPEHIACL